MRLTSTGKQAALTASIDLDQATWLEAEARRQSAHISVIVRQAIREKMEREQQPERISA